MVSYLADLMEDATDFTWQGAKAAHAVLMCEMERGTVQWEDGDQIDRIRRAHAQKHVSHRPNWGKQDNNKKPWFCKKYQSNSCTFAKNHETNGILHRHICAYCLNLGKHFTHPEKNCITKQQQLKKRADICPSLGWSSYSKNDVNVAIQGDRGTGNAWARRCTGSVAQTSNGKTCDSCYPCEASVLNPVSSGLQCEGELVKDSTAAGGVSHNSICESSRVSEIAIGSNASHDQKCETSGVKAFTTGDSSKNYRVRFVYNSRVVPRQVDALLARKPARNNVKMSKAELFGAVSILPMLSVLTVSPKLKNVTVKWYIQLLKMTQMLRVVMKT